MLREREFESLSLPLLIYCTYGIGRGGISSITTAFPANLMLLVAQGHGGLRLLFAHQSTFPSVRYSLVEARQ
jgi:hypothetical protein